MRGCQVALALAIGALLGTPVWAGSLAEQKAVIEKACANETFSGAILVARAGQPDWTFACGYADRETKSPMTTATPMRIASMGKMFTAVAILQLVEAGKVDLDAPLARYIPDYPNHDLAVKVTIRHLLLHQGGTGDIFVPEATAHHQELRDLADYMRVFGSRAALFEPGSKRQYSNYGFILLGLVVEKASGEDYFRYLQRHIFAVAGMTATTYPIEAELTPPPSNGYTRLAPDAPLTKVGLEELPLRATSAGGCFSTVGDLNRFAQALMSGKLISPAMFNRVVAGEQAVGRFSFGFGRGVDKTGRVWIGFAGGAPGNNGELEAFPAQNMVVVTLSNFDPPAADKWTEGLATATD